MIIYSHTKNHLKLLQEKIIKKKNLYLKTRGLRMGSSLLYYG